MRLALRELAAVIPLLVLGAGCAATPPQPQLLAANYDQLKIRTVAVLPVVFADYPLERYNQIRYAEEIRWHVGRVLENKGYRVTIVPAAGSYAQPAGASFRAEDLARQIPDGQDGGIAIRIDHFLDTGLYDRSDTIGLDIYATAVLISPGGEVLWRDQGDGRGQTGFASGSNDRMAWFVVPADLANSLFDTLPDAAP